MYRLIGVCSQLMRTIKTKPTKTVPEFSLWATAICCHSVIPMFPLSVMSIIYGITLADAGCTNNQSQSREVQGEDKICKTPSPTTGKPK